MTEKEELSALETFKDNIDNRNCLSGLNEWINKFNIFDVLKISNLEIRHSNVLAWLLDPKESHGLSDKILKNLYNYCCENEITSRIDNIDFSSFGVLREWENIDIMVISNKHNFLFCIENKIYSGENGNQLERYAEYINGNYQDYNCVYLFLTPDGHESSLPNLWNAISYSEILLMIEKSVGCASDERVKHFIEDYIEVIGRITMGNEEVINKCIEIYMNNKAALDLIYENVKDRKNQVNKIVRKWAEEKAGKGDIVYTGKNDDSTNTRFTTRKLNEVMPKGENNNSWKVKNSYFYEIVNCNEKKLFMKLELCGEFPRDAREKEKVEKLKSVYKLFNPDTDPKKIWWEVFKAQEEIAEENYYNYSEADIYKYLDESLDFALYKQKKIVDYLKNGE